MRDAVDHPYATAPPEAFWKTAVAERGPFELAPLWRPGNGYSPSDRWVTYGTCFAQHVSGALQERGLPWVDAEPAPAPWVLPPDLARRFGYGVFSARTQNVYTTAVLRQWLEWATGEARPPDEVWQEGGRFFDPFRPTVEPEGFASRDELEAARACTLDAVRSSVAEGDVLFLTLGLTESWINRDSGYTYAACPGTARGAFDPARHRFRNMGFDEVRSGLRRSVDLVRAVNPAMRVLLTVSPMPLVATASGGHVVTATTYSKAVLRAVAGEAAESVPGVDYFPVLEYFTSPALRGMLFEPGLRRPSRFGIRHALSYLFDVVGVGAGAPDRAAATGDGPAAPAPTAGAERAVLCEAELLEAFGGAAGPGDRQGAPPGGTGP